MGGCRNAIDTNQGYGQLIRHGYLRATKRKADLRLPGQ
jgi:hypothetical protein